MTEKNKKLVAEFCDKCQYFDGTWAEICQGTANGCSGKPCHVFLKWEGEKYL